MHPSRKDLIVPIRARSALTATYDDLLENPTVRNAPTRPSLIHRRQDMSAEGELAMPLVVFTTDLREEVRRLPLTILIHGWITPASEEFLATPGLLERGDALWLISSTNQDQLAIPVGEAVVLKPNWVNPNNDSRLYDNLVADIAYFPAAEDIELGYLNRIQGRVRTIVIDQSGSHNIELLDSIDPRLRRYLWAFDQIFIVGSTNSSVSVQDKTDDDQISPEMVRSGKMLKEVAEYLGAEMDRRFEFRSYIERVRRKFSEQSQFKIQLILTADRHEWPGWAVECVPSFYVPKQTNRDGSVVALVWRRIFLRLPQQPQIKSELCNGQFVEASLSKTHADQAEMIARTIEEHLGRNPYPSDSGFLGTIDQAFFELEVESEANSNGQGQD
jgi:hypothetical protein